MWPSSPSLRRTILRQYPGTEQELVENRIFRAGTGLKNQGMISITTRAWTTLRDVLWAMGIFLQEKTTPQAKNEVDTEQDIFKQLVRSADVPSLLVGSSSADKAQGRRTLPKPQAETTLAVQSNAATLCQSQERRSYGTKDMQAKTKKKSKGLRARRSASLLERRARRSRVSEDQRRREENPVNELKNLDFVKKDAKPCPTCGMAISKSAGCNKMTCSSCGQYFCFKCGKRIDGYLHFG
ncbi:hypothetical protein SELMODRAFT_412398 [Selaginella moellendorffii]|uniref:IBR domain-containing protein n=1 Tax=Selaginella moellendorffii TaxID=88036 RepID=D8RL13_SELML|nr:hypothetical protein SELMODRAFT_412398 [Selaginella moellendorffii]